jgi:adenosylcobinamide kinase/adenosylcobinamide-phosphate guanylyltransferase
MERALSAGPRRVFLATAQVWDDEMRARVDAHQREREDRFETVEAPLELAAALHDFRDADSIIVDCLTLWLTNVMLAEPARDIAAETAALCDALRECRGQVLLVTNEVGCGIVPENALARRFRDEAGRLNQRIAAVADEVFWMVFGCPLRVK